MRIRFLLFLIAFLAATSSAPSIAAERFALVIGNSKYFGFDQPPKEPVNDARDLAAELRQEGFSVDVGENLADDEMSRSFEAFYQKQQQGSVALIYFSGFAVQYRGKTFLIPVDRQISSESDIVNSGYSLDAVLAQLDRYGAGVKIALIDAGRRNPTKRLSYFSVGLEPVIAPNNAIVMYSTAPSSFLPNSTGDHGLFVQELIKQMRASHASGDEVLSWTREAVISASHGDQVPLIASSLKGSFSFASSFVPAAVASTNPPANVQAVVVSPPSVQSAVPTLVPRPAVPLGRRVALILGNGAYKSMPTLMNPRNDATDVEAALKSLGFETVTATDLDLESMGRAVGRFSRIVRGADVAIVYYSGHGMQFDGKNYLLPVDADLESVQDVNRYKLLPVDDLIEVLGGASADGLKLIVLDACRSNAAEQTFKNRLASVPGASRDVALTRGFARVTRSGLIITYATAPNEVASDGIGRNSPFTKAFLNDVGIPDIDVRQMLFRVQSDVYAASGKSQLPETSTLYTGPEVRLKTSQR